MSETENILIYDLAVLPKHQTAEHVFNIYKSKGVILWCSAGVHNFSGRNLPENKPQVLDKKTLEEKEFKFIDTQGMSEEQIKNFISNEPQ